MPIAGTNIKRLILCAAVAAIFSACDSSTLVAGNPATVAPDVELYPRTPRIVLDGHGVYQLAGTIVTLRGVDGSHVLQTISTPTTDTASAYFDGVVGDGSYLVTISKEGFAPTTAMVNQTLLSRAQEARIDLLPWSDSPEIETEERVIGAESETFPAPLSIRGAISSTKVSISNGTALATVSTLTPSVVPPIFPSGDRGQPNPMFSAAHVRFAGISTGVDLRVELPIPTDSTSYASAMGAEVDAWLFDTATLRWASLGTAVINGEGRAAVLISKPDTETLVAISQPVEYHSSYATLRPIAEYGPSELAGMVARGETTIETPLDVNLYIGPTVPGAALESDWSADSAFAWDILLPRILFEIPELQQWWHTGDDVVSTDIDKPGLWVYEVTRWEMTATANLRFGDVTRSFRVKMAYTVAGTGPVFDCVGYPKASNHSVDPH